MPVSKIFPAAAVLVTAFFWTNAANAIPAFAREYKIPCTTCHTAWPNLNRVGRQFKENGYRLSLEESGKEKISSFLEWDEHLPVTAVLVSRPYDEKKSGVAKNRALHEVELIVGGQIYRNVSGWFEFEAEDEEGFETSAKEGILGYHPSRALNVQAGWAHLLWADPYDTYAATRLLTGPNRPQFINQNFGGADRPDASAGRLRDNRQFVNLYGRPLEQFFYSVGYASVTDDPEGSEPKTYHARLAFDITTDAMIGLLVAKGTCAAIGTTRPNCAVDRDYDRSGVDFQVDVAGARVLGAFLKAEDDNAAATATVENTAWFVQGSYVVSTEGRPTWVPLLRYDTYEKSNGTQEFTEALASVTYYFTHNIKGFVEYWDQLDVPPGQAKDNRLTLQFVAAF